MVGADATDLNGHTIGGSGRRCFTSGEDQKDKGKQAFLMSIASVTMVPREGMASGDFNDGSAKTSTPSDDYGGALYISGIHHAVTLTDVVFAGFHVAKHGGAVAVIDVGGNNAISFSRVLFAACAVGDNRVGFHGLLSFGVKDTPDQSLTLDSIEQTATAAAAEEDDEEIEGQFVQEYGGAVVLLNSVANFVKVSFEHNKATNGGAVAVISHDVIDNSLSMLRKDMAVYAAEATFESCEFHNNGAKNSGGAIFVVDGVLDMEDTRFGDAYEKVIFVPGEGTTPERDRMMCSRVRYHFDDLARVAKKSATDVGDTTDDARRSESDVSLTDQFEELSPGAALDTVQDEMTATQDAMLAVTKSNITTALDQLNGATDEIETYMAEYRQLVLTGWDGGGDRRDVKPGADGFQWRDAYRVSAHFEQPQLTLHTVVNTMEGILTDLAGCLDDRSSAREVLLVAVSRYAPVLETSYVEALYEKITASAEDDVPLSNMVGAVQVAVAEHKANLKPTPRYGYACGAPAFPGAETFMTANETARMVAEDAVIDDVATERLWEPLVMDALDYLEEVTIQTAPQTILTPLRKENETLRIQHSYVKENFEGINKEMDSLHAIVEEILKPGVDRGPLGKNWESVFAKLKASHDFGRALVGALKTYRQKMVKSMQLGQHFEKFRKARAKAIDAYNKLLLLLASKVSGAYSESSSVTYADDTIIQNDVATLQEYLVSDPALEVLQNGGYASKGTHSTNLFSTPLRHEVSVYQPDRDRHSSLQGWYTEQLWYVGVSLNQTIKKFQDFNKEVANLLEGNANSLYKNYMDRKSTRMLSAARTFAKKYENEAEVAAGDAEAAEISHNATLAAGKALEAMRGAQLVLNTKIVTSEISCVQPDDGTAKSNANSVKDIRESDLFSFVKRAYTAALDSAAKCKTCSTLDCSNIPDVGAPSPSASPTQAPTDGMTPIAPSPLFSPSPAAADVCDPAASLKANGRRRLDDECTGCAECTWDPGSWVEDASKPGNNEINFDAIEAIQYTKETALLKALKPKPPLEPLSNSKKTSIVQLEALLDALRPLMDKENVLSGDQYVIELAPFPMQQSLTMSEAGFFEYWDTIKEDFNEIRYGYDVRFNVAGAPVPATPLSFPDTSEKDPEACSGVADCVCGCTCPSGNCSNVTSGFAIDTDCACTLQALCVDPEKFTNCKWDYREGEDEDEDEAEQCSWAFGETFANDPDGPDADEELNAAPFSLTSATSTFSLADQMLSRFATIITIFEEGVVNMVTRLRTLPQIQANIDHRMSANAGQRRLGALQAFFTAASRMPNSTEGTVEQRMSQEEDALVGFLRFRHYANTHFYAQPADFMIPYTKGKIVEYGIQTINVEGQGMVSNLKSLPIPPVKGGAHLVGSGNRASRGDGGAIFALNSVLTMSKDSGVYNGIATKGDGGAIRLSASILNVVGSYLHSNHAVNGGAISADMSVVSIKDSSLSDNQAYRDGGAVQSTESSQISIDGSVLRGNVADCPIRAGPDSPCADWGDTFVQGSYGEDNLAALNGDDPDNPGFTGLQTYCVNPTCLGYMGNGGAVSISAGARFKAQATSFVLNMAIGAGGGVYAEDTVDFTISESAFEGCEIVETNDLDGDPEFCAGGGALYLTLTKYALLTNVRPKVVRTVFRENHVDEGSGGAVFWSVPTTMFDQIDELGSFVSLEGYDAKPDAASLPLASNNSASWGGRFIASGPYSLVVLKGPKHTQARTAPSQRHCDNVDDTGVCPYECSGHEPFNGQQCIVYQNLPSKVQPATVKGGVPIKENSPTLEVAVVDFYDFIVETAAEPVFVSVSVDLTELALLPAYDSQGVLTNCTQTSTWNKPDICEYNLSPVGDSRLVSALPEHGVAKFHELTIHARPTSVVYKLPPVSGAGGASSSGGEAEDFNPYARLPSEYRHTPDMYEFTITSPDAIGVGRTALPRTGVQVEHCIKGQWLDTSAREMSCKKCPAGRYGDKSNLNIDGSMQALPCFACDLGMYQKLKGKTKCLDCPWGRHAPSRAQTECQVCRNGTHTDGAEGQGACMNCPRGKFGKIQGQKELGEQYSDCEECPVGRFQPTAFNPNAAAVWDCGHCPMGYLQPRTGMFVCEGCPAGFVSEEGSTDCKIECPVGTFRKRNMYPAWVHGMHPNVTYRSMVAMSNPPPTSLCFACPIGYSSTEHSLSSEDEDVLMEILDRCIDCAIGRFQSRPGQPACFKCAAGQIADLRRRAACDKCLSGKYQDEKGKWGCKLCEKGVFNPPANDTFIYLRSGDDILSNPVAERSTEHTEELYGFWWTVEAVLPAGTKLTDDFTFTSRTTPEIPFNVTKVSKFPANPRQKKPIDARACKICPVGKWTGSVLRTSDSVNYAEYADRPRWIAANSPPVGDPGAGGHACNLCDRGKYGSHTSRARPLLHQVFADCTRCPENEVTEYEGARGGCDACPDKSWTLDLDGQELCTPCVQGEVFPDDENQDCEKCRGIDMALFNDRGEYSFVSGNTSCHQCAPGKICRGGVEMHDEWGWFTSHGLDAHKAKLKQRMRGKFEGENEDKYPLNFKACAAEYMGALLTNSDAEVLRNNESNAHIIGKYTHGPAECNDRCRGPKKWFYPVSDAAAEAEAKLGDKAEGFYSCYVVTGKILVNDVETYEDVLECLRQEDFIDADCTCKAENDGAPDCRYWCDAGDELYGGIYLDQCGLPLKVTRCPGFKRDITCEEEFTKQMREVSDPDNKRVMISLKSYCQKCRTTTVLQRKKVREVVYKLEISPFKSVASYLVERTNNGTSTPLRCTEGFHQPESDTLALCQEACGLSPTCEEMSFDPESGRCTLANRQPDGTSGCKANETNAAPEERLYARVYVDAMWLYVAGLEWADYTLHDKISGDAWDLEVVSYSLPKLGVWDEDAYIETDAFKTAAIANNIGGADYKRHMKGGRRWISVALPANDPRLERLDEMEAYVRSAQNLNRNVHAMTVAHDSRDRFDEFDHEDFELSALNRTITTPCNVMAGYTGRLCSKCAHGFTQSGKKCHRCPPFWICATTLANGFLIGFVLMIIIVMTVVEDAGSTSTAAALKKIVLNHVQVLGMATSFDLNWNTNTKEFFDQLGAISSVGDQLIQSGCILNSVNLGMEPFYFKQMLYLMFTIAFLIGSFTYWHIREKSCCISKKNRTLSQAIETIEKRSLDRRVMVARLKKRNQNQPGYGNSEVSAGIKRFQKGLRLLLAHKRKFTSKVEKNDFAAQVGKAVEQDRRYLMKAAGMKNWDETRTNPRFRKARARILALTFIERVKTLDLCLNKIFHQYDRGGTGEIGLDEFIAILNAMELGWTPEDCELIAHVYNGGSIDSNIVLSNVVRYGKTATDSIILTWLIVVEVMYPTVVKSCFGLMSCRNDLMDGHSSSWLHSDLHISCVSPGHVAFLIVFVLPTFLVFVLGAPLVGTWMLGRAIEKRGWHDDVTNYRYAVLIGGYKHKNWYWALMVFGRKLFVALVASVMVSYGVKVQFLMAIVVVLAALAMQVALRPFSSEMLNFMETAGLTCLFLSMYLGILFFWDSFDKFTLGVVGDLVIAMNIVFISWLARALGNTWLHQHEGTDLAKWALKYEHKRYFFLVVFLCLPMIPLYMFKHNIASFMGKNDHRSKAKQRKKKLKKFKMKVAPRGKGEGSGDPKSVEMVGEPAKRKSWAVAKSLAVGGGVGAFAKKDKNGAGGNDPAADVHVAGDGGRVHHSVAPAKLWKWDGTQVDGLGNTIDVAVKRTRKRGGAKAWEKKMATGKKVNVHPSLGSTAGGKKKAKAEAEKKKLPKISKKKKTLAKVEASKTGEAAVAAVASKKVDSDEVEAQAELDEKIPEVMSTVPEVKAAEKVESEEPKKGGNIAMGVAAEAGTAAAAVAASSVITTKNVTTEKEKEEEEEEEEGEEEEEEDEAEVQEAGGEPPLGHDEIEGLRTDLGKRVKSAKRLELAFKRLDMDGSGGLCKPEFKRLIVIGAGKNDRFLNDKSRAQLWEAAWNGQPHGPDKELPLEVLQEWIFLANGAPQKIDD